ncbi:MAG TPA: hypothetical protein VK822_28875 [Acetobacteraceae bacterium]|jgi:hypothetical protein|nr:hypothetical protein [Acetobacteraceae bacterium]
MRRIAALLALTVGASLLAGCVYDPYTATWRPCCNYYGYPYYRYPPSYYPYGYPPGPYMAPPQGQPGAYPEQPAQPPPRPGAANYLLPGMPMVTQNFAAIDLDRNGYVTLPEVRASAAQQRAERDEAGQQSIQ